MKQELCNLIAAVALSLPALGAAQTPVADHAAHHSPDAVPTPMTDGEVRKIDKGQGKVTLRHGPIANLEMPAMTMVFKVTDAKMLDNIKEGDQVKFTADRINGAITVTAIEVAK
jgi:Cu/Ag efflux protein CusF